MTNKKYDLKELGIYCGRCLGNNVKIIDQYLGKDVVPENHYDYKRHLGVVVECVDCHEITGFLILSTGVINDDDT